MAQLIGHCATSRKVAGSIPNVIDIILPVDSAFSRNEFQVYFLGGGGKGGWCLGSQPYNLHVPIVLKSGSLSVLEPSGLVKACTGIALLLLYVYV